MKFLSALIVLVFIKATGRIRLTRFDDPTADYDDYIP
jgi:hypothetical protein